MFNSSLSPADVAAISGGDCAGGNGWWLILFILLIFCGGWNNGGFGGSGGVQDAYVLNSDFSQLSRQLDTATDRLATQGNSIANGLCDGFYTQAQLNAQTNMNIAQGNYNTLNAIQQNGYESRLATQTLGSQMQSCCCDLRQQVADVNYNIANQANGITNTVNSGFCQTNYNNQSNTRDIIDSQNANTRAILDAINENKVEALKDRIAEQNQTISALQLSASQQAQNNYIVSTLAPSPKPSYIVANPNASVSYGCCPCSAAM